MVKIELCISNICRLCLGEDDTIPASDVMNSSLTTELIEKFTGIQIDPAGKLAYAICLRCKDNLQRSVEYRDACLNNDILFRQLFFSKSNYSNDHTKETKCSAETIAWDSDAIEFINPATETTPLAAEDGDRSSFEQSIPEFEPEQDECSNPESVAVCELENTNEPKESPQKPGPKRAKQKQLCVLCGKTVTYLARHLNSHTKNSTYSCPHCSQMLTDHSNLMRHIRAVHQKKVIMFCTPCDRGFTSKNSYDAHMRAQHSVGEPLECEICSKTFKQLSGYRKHITLFHKNERNFGCTVCGKLFKSRQALQHHGTVHSSSRPYACGICSKRFKSQFARSTHELAHSGNIFPCSVCDKSYRYKSLLSQHVKKVHPENC
uniref:Uncharacterized protein n=2 Tax=gambiae species complex TaxID=44542 RepID=A0A1S4HE06_ANOGA